MATFTKVNDFVLNLCEAIDIDGDTLQLAFSNTAPGSEASNPTADTNGILGNVTQIAYTNWTDDLSTDRVLTSGTTTHTQSSGTFTLDYGADIVITASGGAIANWRYIYLFDQTVASPVDPLICVWDHGSAIALGSGDSATLQFNASGIFTLS